MKFAAVLFALPALAIAAAIPISTDDALATLNRLVEEGEKGAKKALKEVEQGRTDAEEALLEIQHLTGRDNVPGLHCGSSRAISCAASVGGQLGACFGAVVSGGADFTKDANCIAAAADLGADLPENCRLCLGQ